MLHKAIIFATLLISQNLYADKIDFWDVQRKGANNFNKSPTTEQWFANAKAQGIEWVRLAWGKRRNFLMGSSGNYQGLVEKDLAEIKQTLRYAAKYGIKIVLVPISLPGAQFRQLNGYKNDMRLWTDKKYWGMVAAMWQDLAKEFKETQTVVAYNIFNEPYPEYGTGLAEQTVLGDAERYYTWDAKYKGTPRDLQAFYRRVIAAIRKVDTGTPIMLESGWYSQPNAFVHWEPFNDNGVLYQFHMYEPYAFTSGGNFREKKNWVYPGKVPFGGGTVYWDREALQKYFAPFYQWAAENHIPANRIVAGEFGCMRRNKGCREYLGDMLALLNENKYHWAFYSFQEDEWDGYDYQLGSAGLGWDYWKAVEAGKNPPLPRKDNPLWQVIKQGLDR
ncbi:MAG: cellulase family glycosylhydrolase [Spirochaetota bacterium]